MTVNITFSGTSDGGVVSHNANYGTALGGSSLATSNGTFVSYGLAFNGAYAGEYSVDQAFFQFAYAVPTNEVLSAAYFQFFGYATTDQTNIRVMEVRQYDWGATLDTADYRAGFAALNPLPRLGSMYRAQELDSTMVGRVGSKQLLAVLVGSGNLRVVVHSSGNWQQVTPTGDERSHLYAADQSGTTLDPRLVYTSRPISTLDGVLGASVHLSDGTRVYVEVPDTLASPYGSLVHHDGTTATVIATGLQSSLLAVGNNVGGTVTALQSLSLTRDAANNLYVVQGGTGTTINAEAYAKGAGYSWTRKTMLSASLPSYGSSGDVNVSQVVTAWHSVGGTAGTLFALSAYQPSGWGAVNDQMSVAMLNCDALLAGSGTLIRTSGAASQFLIKTGGAFDLITYQNESGTGMDIAAAPGSATVGFVASYNGTDQVSFCRYTFNGTGDGFDFEARGQASDTISKDANSKLRIVPINSTTFATVYGDRIVVRQNTSGSTFNTLSSVNLATQGIATFPAASTLLHTAAWDAVYDTSSGKLWFYYFSAADGRRLMRTAFNVNTGLATLEEIQVSAAVGAAGTTNVAIRAPRGALAGPSLRIAVANRSASAGAAGATTVYVADSLNAPPNAPTLTAKANYDATAAGVFAWAFSDPTPGDTQSAYQIDINTSAGVDVYDSGKVTSTTQSHTLTAATLTNGNAYQWRVTTWDAANVQGPYSTYGTFSTAAGGTVTITDPAADNPAGVITSFYTVAWSVAGTTQASYRVLVQRTDTNATLLDTGFVAGTQTTYNVTNMLSDVEYRVSVTVQNASAVTSATGTRLITPSYAKPEVPLVAVTQHSDDGYVLVSVVNPAPSGSRPQVTTNQILRRKASTTDQYTVIGAAPANGSYRDYTARSGVTYEYIARGTA